jgi:hypothetical protein
LGTGDYILFHGNLSVSENYEAVNWLIKNVFSKIKFKVVIAGLNPPDFLIREVNQYSNIQLRKNPNEDEMTQLIRNAQVHVLYTAQPTGLKLKLLNVLFKGRFVICNTHLVSGTGLKANDSLVLTDTPSEFLAELNRCFYKDFSEAALNQRQQAIQHFNNRVNATKLIEEVFSLPPN